MNKNDFAVWELKADYDKAIITESDITYYKRQRGISAATAVIITTSKKTVRKVFWPESQSYN